MAGPATLQFTDANFDTEAMQASAPVLIDFWAEWCGPCRLLGPTIDQLATDFQGKAKIGKVDVDSNQKLAVKFGIQSIPTVLLLKNGQVVKKWVGITQKNVLADAITAAI
ncbi:MAG: thioredoxin [Phycisphaerae bacterium]|nr:thioredoxin [Phycisphaerae bacterium]